MRAFSEREKEVIKSRLIKAGEKLFAEQGFSKTSIAQLAQAAGIGKGSFYMFYSSKDELLIDLHKMMHAKWRNHFSEIMSHLHDNPEKTIAEFLHTSLNIFSHPLVLKLQETGDFDRVYRTLSDEDHGEDMSITTMSVLISAAQESGALIPKDPTIIAATIRSICFLGLHKREIGEDIYPQVISLLVQLIAQGLSRRNKHND